MAPYLDFSGNAVTVVGFIGVVSTFVILMSVWRAYWTSPYRR